MNDREKLIELIHDCTSCEECHDADIADHLLANGVTVLRWIPVTERLPEEGEDVLVFGYWHERYQPLKCHLSPHYKGRWFTSVAGQEVYAVTHWMPLPQSPKGE